MSTKRVSLGGVRVDPDLLSQLKKIYRIESNWKGITEGMSFSRYIEWVLVNYVSGFRKKVEAYAKELEQERIFREALKDPDTIGNLEDW